MEAKFEKSASKAGEDSFFGGKKAIPKDRYQTLMKIKSNGKEVEYGGMEFVFNDDATLNKNFSPNGRTKPMTVTAANIVPLNVEPSSFPTYQQAQFSILAKTPSSGIYDSTGSRDKPSASGSSADQSSGQLSGRPYLHHNPTTSVTSVDYAIGTYKPGAYSHEMNLRNLDPSGGSFSIIDSNASSPLINSTYGIRGYTTERGIKSGSYLEIPTGPMQAIADFRRSNAFSGPYLPLTAQPVANSYASPLIDPAKSKDGELLDYSVLANSTLYDQFYFSTIAPIEDRKINKVFEDFISGQGLLSNQSFAPFNFYGRETDAIMAEMFQGDKALADGYKYAAEYQMLKSPFNINSIDVNAWVSVLSSLKGINIPIMDRLTAAFESKQSKSAMIPGMSLHNGFLDSTVAINASDEEARSKEWNSPGQYSDQEIRVLAEKIVEKIKGRGPFLSLSHFLNREVSEDAGRNTVGPLQEGIDASGLNDKKFKTEIPVAEKDISDSNRYAFKTAATSVGNPAAGAPGWLMQADVVKLLEPGMTVRSDTFVIRTCGEAKDKNGKVIARAYAEAVVQRVPEYLDPKDRSSSNVVDPKSNVSEVNKRFGRRFLIGDFRWLSSNDI